jgi:hypothetical protein
MQVVVKTFYKNSRLIKNYNNGQTSKIDSMNKYSKFRLKNISVEIPS